MRSFYLKLGGASCRHKDLVDDRAILVVLQERAELLAPVDLVDVQLQEEVLLAWDPAVLSTPPLIVWDDDLQVNYQWRRDAD
jgi:hypothetical protein